MDIKEPGDAATSPGKNEKKNDINNTITQLLGTSLDDLVLSWDKKKTFINRLSSLSDRTKLSNLFYDIARKNTNLKPVELFDLVADKLMEADSPLFPYLYTFKPEAIQFAEYVLEKEQLPQDIRLAIKHYISDKYRKEYMEKDPPTEKQIHFIRELGYTGLVQNKLDASKIISKLMGERK